MSEKGQWSNWYADRRWRAKRARQLEKEPLCRFCAKQGLITVATICDHVIPHKGDKQLFYFGEVMSLCKTCHDSTKKLLEQQASRPIGADTEGWPLDIGPGGIDLISNPSRR